MKVGILMVLLLLVLAALALHASWHKTVNQKLVEIENQMDKAMAASSVQELMICRERLYCMLESDELETESDRHYVKVLIQEINDDIATIEDVR